MVASVTLSMIIWEVILHHILVINEQDKALELSQLNVNSTMNAL